MTTIRVLLAGLLGALGLVLLTPSASQACSCAAGSTADFAQWSDTVFTGTLVDVVPPPEQPVMSSGDPATYSFEVDGVRKGVVDPLARVRSAISGASCGLEGMQVGARYVVFATDDDGLWANLCGGTGRVGPGELPPLDRVLGPARPASGVPGTAILASTVELLHGWW